MSLYHHRVGEGPDLVLLHGWGMNAAVWEPLQPRLARHFRVTVLELPGHGASAPAMAADLDEWASACLDVAPPRSHWLGWSLGGQVAIQAALAAPERVDRLTLVAATPRFVQSSDWGCAMPVDRFHLFADALGGDPNGTLMRFLGLQVTGAEHARETLKLLRSELGERPAASVEGLRQGLELLLETDLRGPLGRLARPSHWLFGSRDTLVPPGVSERVRSLLPGAKLSLIEGAGHAPFLSHPEQSLESLLHGRGG
jgi:pimeloyl-[acyl-carrier protein] methyl ester esterase